MSAARPVTVIIAPNTGGQMLPATKPDGSTTARDTEIVVRLTPPNAVTNLLAALLTCCSFMFNDPNASLRKQYSEQLCAALRKYSAMQLDDDNHYFRISMPSFQEAGFSNGEAVKIARAVRLGSNKRVQLTWERCVTSSQIRNANAQFHAFDYTELFS